GYLHGDPGDDILSGSSPKNQGLHIGQVVAVIDNENKLGERDERAAARGALRRGRELVCISTDRAAQQLGIVLKQGDGIEFRAEDREYLVNPPAGGVTTYVKDLGSGMLLAGDFERGARTGDSVFRVTDHELMEEALNAPEKKLPVTVSFTARKGQFPTLVMTDVRLGISTEITADHVVEEARKAPTDAGRLESNLARLGDTPYTTGLTGIDIEIDDDIMMPVSIVNRMRREASEELLKARLDVVVSGRRPKLTKEELERIRETEALGSSALDTEAFSEKIAGSGRKPVAIEKYMENSREGIEQPSSVLPYILNVSKGRLDVFIEKNFDEIAEACRETGILIGNLGWIERFRKAGVKVYGDYGLNVYNMQALKAYEELGVELYMPSHETGVSDERGIPLMITEHHVNSAVLTDRKGAVHEVRTALSGDKTLIY
ncbi:MAG: DUF3656 domain-containing protein, partial [Mogibacterium sp.]|nr:DUF3656 domain-containing protein [Mogibacterium sp.]